MSMGNLAFAQLGSLRTQAGQALDAARSPGLHWAATYRGPLADDPLQLATAAPGVTMGTIGAGTTISGGLAIANTAAQITRLGAWQATSDSVFIAPDRTGGRIRFNLFGPRVDVRVARSTTSTRGFSILVDGRLLTRTPFDQAVAGFAAKSAASSARQWMQIDFGANVQTYALARANVGVAGTGYAVGDTITIGGGTFASAAVLRVTGVNAGAVTNVIVQSPGSYTAPPNSPLAQSATSGSGTGFQATAPIWHKLQSSATRRLIEIVFDYGTMFGGLTLPPGSAVTAADPVPSPKLVIAGDSITEYLMADYAVGTWAWQVARRLNLADRFVPYGTAGRGWLMSTPFSLDVAGIIAEAPDFLVIALGTNDALGSVDPATLTATVTARLNEIRAALPAVRIVVAGPFAGDGAGTATAAIAAGVAAANAPQWLRFIDFRALGVYSETSPWACVGNTASTTDVHPSQAGHDVIGAALTPLVGAALREMALTV